MENLVSEFISLLLTKKINLKLSTEIEVNSGGCLACREASSLCEKHSHGVFFNQLFKN